MAISTFAEVQAIINNTLTPGQKQDILGGGCPHHDFWSTPEGGRNVDAYNQFVFGNVPNVTDPDTGAPIPILVKGNSADSVIIQIMLGTGKYSNDFGPMPASGPLFDPAIVKEIAEWIDAGCNP